MIDLHSHLLPDIDDGSRSVEQSIDVLNAFASIGVTDVVLTPHVAASELEIDHEDALERRAVAYELLKPVAPPSPRLHLGFEIMLDQPLGEAALLGRQFTLAGSRYILVEFFLSVSADRASEVLRHIVDAGLVPIVAHVERYRVCSQKLAARWRDIGALLQVDATTLTRASPRGRKARDLVAAGLADVAAADNHGDGRTVETAVMFLGERGFGEAAHQLCVANPRAVISDREVQPVPPTGLRESLWDRIKGHIGF